MQLKILHLLALSLCLSTTSTFAQNSDLCFKRQVGKQFHYADSNNTKIKIENTTFEQKSAIAVISESGGILFKDIFDLTGRRLLANLMYALEDNDQSPSEIISELSYHSPYPQFPTNMSIGQKFQIHLNPIHRHYNIESPTENTILNMEFKGFETLDFIMQDENLLSLKQVCHFSTQTDVGFFDEWYAEGYGLVQSIQKSVDGVIMSIQSIGQTP